MIHEWKAYPQAFLLVVHMNLKSKHSSPKEVHTMLLRVGCFEVEIHSTSIYLRMGSFERFWNLEGLPSH